MAELVTAEHIREKIVCGPDASKHIEQVNKYVEAGFDHVYVTQAGPEQEAFIRFYKEQVMPKLELDCTPAMVAAR
jgi:capsule polysaccharide export protein KpsE/RkpR